MATVLNAPSIEAGRQVQIISPEPLKSQPQADRIHQLVILDNDTNLLKGILWGWVGLGFGKGTILSTVATVMSASAALASLSSKDMSTPGFFVLGSMGAGLLTFVLGSCTMKCASNCFYHFGSRQLKVIQLSN